MKSLLLTLLILLTVISCGYSINDFDSLKGFGLSDHSETEDVSKSDESDESDENILIPSNPWLIQLGADTGPESNSQWDSCNDVAVDNEGNVYCAGFSYGAIGEANGSGGGENDAFVMKLNSDGEIQWVTQLGAETTAPGGDNSRSDYCNGVAVDNEGNVYCAGYTNGAMGEDVYDNSGDAFLMKLDSEGVLQWVTQLGANTTAPGGNNDRSDLCNDVTVDNLGNVYCAGYTNGAMGEASALYGGDDAFVMKLNTDGELQWVTQLGANTMAPGGDNSWSDYCNGVAVDNEGNVYCAGYTNGAMGEANGSSSLGDSFNENDAFVMKLNSEGELQWVTQLGANTIAPGGDNSRSDYCNGVAVDNEGNVFCAGYTGGAVGEANGGVDGGAVDAFVMKINTDGELQWVTQLGAETVAEGGDNSRSDYCNGVAIDNEGSVFCAGYTDGAVGEANGGSSLGDSLNYDDAFVMKLNSEGELQWVSQLGAVTSSRNGNNNGHDQCHGVAVDSSSNVYCAGYTTGSLGEANAGSDDAFVMKLNPEGKLDAE